MEFHLPNEREIKTIRPRAVASTRSKPLVGVRPRPRPLPRSLARHSLIFTLGILDPETTFDSRRRLQFFRAVLFIHPIPHLSLSPRRSFITASFTVRLPLAHAAPSVSVAEREEEGKRGRDREKRRERE